MYHSKTTMHCTTAIPFSLLITLCMLLSACAEVITPFMPPAALSPQTELRSISSIITPEATQDPTSQIVETEPVLLWFEPEVPSDMWMLEELPAGMIWSENEVSNAVILGLSERMLPSKQVLAEVEWIYALAAPFFTIQDEVTAEDLQAFWQGRASGSMANVTRLVVRNGDLNSLISILGEASGATVTIVPNDVLEIPQEGTPGVWTILPFNRLQPQWKVISIDGKSPLEREFLGKDYPLSARYALYAGDEQIANIAPEVLDAFVSGLQVTNRNPEKMTTLVMTGVTALVRATAHRMEIKGITYPAEDILDWLKEADIIHISNEVSFWEDCPYPDPGYGGLNFCSNPDYIQLFEYIGADVIELTGNHNNDTYYKYGVDTVPFSLDLYTQRGMLYFGGGLNLADSMQPAILEHNGNKLAFIGCNAFGPDFAWATETQGGSAPCIDFTWMADEIRRLRSEGYLPIATFQYYEDYNDDASPQQKLDFRMMAEAGAVIVNGSQAHRPKEMEFYDQAFIHYGLGNLFFDQMGIEYNGVYYPETRWEFIQCHIFYDGRYISTVLLTAMLEDYAKPRPMTESERQIFLEQIFSVSQMR